VWFKIRNNQHEGLLVHGGETTPGWCPLCVLKHEDSAVTLFLEINTTDKFGQRCENYTRTKWYRVWFWAANTYTRQTGPGLTFVLKSVDCV